MSYAVPTARTRQLISVDAHSSGTGSEMKRAKEHVELLYSQYEGLMESIADLEEEIEQVSRSFDLPNALYLTR